MQLGGCSRCAQFTSIGPRTFLGGRGMGGGGWRRGGYISDQDALGSWVQTGSRVLCRLSSRDFCQAMNHVSISECLYVAKKREMALRS